MRRRAFICAADEWSVSCTSASSRGWASACRGSSARPESDNRCERAPAPRSAWADYGGQVKKKNNRKSTYESRDQQRK